MENQVTQNIANFRFYEELNDFLPSVKKKSWIDYYFSGNPTVKDAIEAIGIPHVEVDLILVNSESVTFDYRLQNNDRISVYPVFESIDISKVTHLRAKPLRNPKFILDVHLGKLCKHLRLLGFDTLYENDYEDSEIIRISLSEKRIILTRDKGILKNGSVTHGYWLRSQDSGKQVEEVITRFDLHSSIKPFSRCMKCNGKVMNVNKDKIIDKLEPMTKKCYDEFFQCSNCKQIYWKGSHFEKMNKFIINILENFE